MKTTPRFSCRLVRSWISIFGDPQNPGGLGARHIADCPACQEYFAAEELLTSALTTEAKRSSQPLPSDFERSVMQAISHSKAEAATARRRRPASLLFAGSGIGVAALVAFMVLRHNGIPDRMPETINVGSIPSTAATGADNTALSWDELAAPVSEALQKDPLQAETESVYADAKGALNFLALNFLPAGATSARPDSTSPSTPKLRANG